MKGEGYEENERVCEKGRLRERVGRGEWQRVPRDLSSSISCGIY
jgi:hypothetical protein